MKKFGLIFLTILFIITGLMVEGVQAHWRGPYHGGWRGPGIFFRFPVVVGLPLFPFGYYPRPPVVVRQPQVFVQPTQENTDYWYYCENPKGYYPYVKNCPYGWMKVVPNTNPETNPPN